MTSVSATRSVPGWTSTIAPSKFNSPRSTIADSAAAPRSVPEASEIVERHDLFVQHADSGHGEPNGSATDQRSPPDRRCPSGARQDHGVDVIADIDVAGRGEAFTDHHLVGLAGIRQASRHHFGRPMSAPPSPISARTPPP